MFHAVGNAIMFMIKAPIRVYRWSVEAIVATRKFLNLRRNQLCAAIIAIMMAIVGIQLRDAGYADARPGEYAAVEFEELREAPTEPIDKRTRTSVTETISNSFQALKSKLPSLSGSERPQVPVVKSDPPPRVSTHARLPQTPRRKPQRQQQPITTVSQRTFVAPKPPTFQRQRTLILPEPTIIDLNDIQEPKPRPAPRTQAQRQPTQNQFDIPSLPVAARGPAPIKIPQPQPKPLSIPKLPPAPEPEPELPPDIASLSGLIETDEFEETGDSYFDKK